MKYKVLAAVLGALLAAGCNGGHSGPDNSPPRISAVADQSLSRDGKSAALAFTVADAETPAGSLVVAAESDNAALIGPAGLVLGGSGGSRSLSLVPTAGASGTARITLTVRDAGGLSASTRFTLSVSATQVAFQGYAYARFAEAAEGEPAPVEGLEFIDGSADDPGAYDPLLGP